MKNKLFLGLLTLIMAAPVGLQAGKGGAIAGGTIGGLVVGGLIGSAIAKGNRRDRERTVIVERPVYVQGSGTTQDQEYINQLEWENQQLRAQRRQGRRSARRVRRKN